MPRFFQHIERPKEDAINKKMKSNFGQVTELKYIDDISDPDMIMYYFKDGSCCNREFIAPWNEENLLSSGKAMIEIVNPSSIWKFKRRERAIDLDIDKNANKIMGTDGVIYEAPSFTELIGVNKSKSEWDVERAPYRPEKYETSDDSFMLSMHPDLESGGTADESAGASAIIKNKKSATKKAAVAVKESEEEDFTLDDDFEPVLPETNKKQVIPPAQQLKTLKNAQVAMTIPEETKEIIIDRGNGYSEKVSISEILNDKREIARLKEENEKLRAMPVANNPGARYMEGEDVLIKNMIEKSKTKSCKISMKISMELPPKELYDTIKLAYPEGMTEQFVSSLTARISLDKLLESLNGGLMRFYAGDTASKTQKKNSDDDNIEKPETHNK